MASFRKIATLLLITLSMAKGRPTENIATIIVMGRSGTGITTSVSQILGPENVQLDPTGSPSMVKEFRIPVPGQQKSTLKIVDVEGLVDGKSLEHDAQVLSSLKSYITNPSNLNGATPNFFLVISNFDDNNLRGRDSQFVQLVKRVESFQKALYNQTLDNTVFLMTKLLSESKQNQKFPEDKLELFRQAVRDYTDFVDPIEMVVGENYGRKAPSGYLKLANKEEYPKNVFDALIRIAEGGVNKVGASVVRDWRDSRNKSGIEIPSSFYAYSPQSRDETAFANLISNFRYQVDNFFRKITTFIYDFLH